MLTRGGTRIWRVWFVGVVAMTGVVALPAQDATAMPSTVLNFTGQVEPANGPTPPDPMGAAGANHYVQVVNTNIEVWNKAGTVAAASKSLNVLWTGYVGTNAGNGCATHNDGDPIVRYDQLAGRWLIAQFSLPNTSTSGGPAFECVAVSKTNDPTGAYWLYDFKTNESINDQTKIGVWSDGYYETSNLYNASGSSFVYAGAQVCAWDRSAMLAGSPATQQCFNAGTDQFGLLAANADGSVPPPAGAPEQIIAENPNAANSINVWQFHVDWTTPGNSTLTGPTSLATQAFTDACSTATDHTTCIPQPGTTAKLESQGDLLMDRLTYRNFGTYESLVVTKSVTAGAGSGIAWWEIRLPGGTPTIFQQGIYAPNDTNWRWMPSAVQDQAGDIALGYSISSAGTGVTHPSIAWAGRLATDSLGSMGGTQSEAITTTGLGNETSASRWGDYSSMTVDPSDDCTFWYTNEVYAGTGLWTTKIANGRFSSCAANDFSLGADPSLSVAQGASGGAAVTTAVTAGSAESVSLNVSGLPAGATASFSPAAVTAGAGSTLTVTAGAATPPGTYPLLITGTATSAYHGTTLTLTVVANAVPSCTGQPSATATTDTATPLTLNCTDADAGDTVTISITSGPAHGTVSTPDSGGNVTYTSDSGYSGPDSFDFAATDSHGATSAPAVVDVTVNPPDTTAPTVEITGGPPAQVRSTSASVSFTATDADDATDALTVTCTLDVGTAGPCTSPKTLSGLTQGSHTLFVQAQDPANNTGNASRTWFVDTVAPKVSMTAPTARLTTVAHVVATSTATDTGGTGVVSRDYRYRRAAYNGTFGAYVYPTGWQGTTASSVSLTGAAGYTYCVSARARDHVANVSGWSAERCIAVALDDRSLSASAGWARATGTAFYLRTATVTSKLGATLTRTGLATDRLGLVATVCASCGKVAVYVNGHLLATVNLASSATHYARLISLPTFSLRAATVTLKVLTSGKPVQIDGLATSRV